LVATVGSHHGGVGHPPTPHVAGGVGHPPTPHVAGVFYMHVTVIVGALLADENKHLARYIRQALAIDTGQVVDIRVESDLS
jgi:hypothetical protein